MTTKLYLPTIALLLLLLAWPWAGLDAAITTRAGYEETPSENRFNFFDAEILQSVANAHTGNIVLSPIGIKTLLGMILEGAGGNSAEQIRTALRLPERQDVIRRLFQHYISTIREPSPGIKLEMASSLFMAKQQTPSHEYASSLQQYYANVIKLDFTNPEQAARTINSRIRDITRGFIPKLIDEDNIHPDAQALLTNAIYFKGRWKIPFERDATKVRCFYTAPGVCYNTNMMDTVEFFKYNYIHELNADALELPYQDEKFSMLIVAPKEIDGIVQLQRDLSHFPVHSIINALETTEVLVSLPRFEIDFSTDLVPNLNRLGIQDIFGPNSNLTGMFERNENTIQVSNVFHKAKIIVNEVGSEAAAGTGALVIPLMGSTLSKFRVDRPFLFFIRDVTKGITLFAGRVSVPEAASPQYQRPRPQSSTPASQTENSEDGLYSGIFSSTKPPNSNLGSGVNYHPAATRRPTSRPVLSTGSSQGRPTGTSVNEGTQNSFVNHNNNSTQNKQNSQNSGVVFENTDNQNRGSQQSNSQYTDRQSSFPQQESRPQTQNIYPQNVPQNTDKQFYQTSFTQQNPPIHQQPSYIPQNLPINQQQQLNSPLLSNRPVSSIHSTNKGLVPVYSQNTDGQFIIRDNSFLVLQPPTYNAPYTNTQTLTQPSGTRYQSGNQQSYSQPQIPGNVGVYSTNNRESQQASSQQSHTGSRNDNPTQAQNSQTTIQQSQKSNQDQIFFQTKRDPHSSN